MKILITGVNGLLGSELFKLYKSSENIIIPTSRNIEGNATIKLDITNQKEVYDVFNEFRPDVVINTAAIADVDLCETEKDLCWKTNVTSINHLAEACKDFEIHLIHISTDYIFDGKNGPYMERDKANPISYYGKSKLEGEKILLTSSIDYTIIRTILVYGNHTKPNIVSFVKKSLESGTSVKLVDDQHRMPTLVGDLAQACDLVVNKTAKGIFHISGNEMMNYYDIGLKIADYFSLDESLIIKTKTSKLNQKAKRPEVTGFILDKAIKELDYVPTPFEKSLEEFR